MKIVLKRTKDYLEALAIAEQAKDYFEEGFDELKQDLKSDFLYGAYTGDEMVGFITFKETNKNVIEISWIAVLPKYRNKGIGTQLVERTLNLLKKKYKICEVKTLAETKKDKGYAKTRKFYKKLGFSPLEIIDPYPKWSGDNPCQIFIKCLNCY